MSLVNPSVTDTGTQTADQAEHEFGEASTFRFVPRELAVQCRKLVESYHAIHGYARLPDMLWHSDARDVIERHRDLTKIFKSASRSRCAKRADELFLLIATAIVSAEILARDFAGWGKRFPAAKREAEELLVDVPQRQRVWFMDKYLYPSLDIDREIAGALAPAAPVAAMARN